MARHYSVVLTYEPLDGSWTARVPAFPDSLSTGDTIEEALANAEESIRLFISLYEEEGLPVPEEDRSVVAMVAVA